MAAPPPAEPPRGATPALPHAPPRAARSLSKNEGLVDNPETKQWFQQQVAKIMESRQTPLTLILENSPGQKWHPNDK